MTELRRFILDPAFDPDLTRLGTIVNRLVDMANGVAGGRQWLIGPDDGIRQEILGGATIDIDNYRFRSTSDSGKLGRFEHSNGVDIVLDITDAGIVEKGTVGITGAVTITGNTAITGTFGVTGNSTLTGTLTVSGAATLQSTLAVTGDTTLTGALIANGAVTLGNAAGDVITVTGTMTVAENLTLTKGLIVDATTLVVDATNNKVGVLQVPTSTSATLDVAGQMRVTASTGAPSAGEGIEFGYNAGVGAIAAFDRTGAAYKALNINALTLALGNAAGVGIKIDGTGIGFFGTAGTAQPAAGAAATDPASTQTLANALRTGLRAMGLFS